MDLKAYLEQRGIGAVRELADKVGTTYPYLSQIAYGHRKPSAAFAKRLEEQTEGVLTRGELRPDLYGPADMGKAA